MFRALLCPSSGARQTAIAASGFRMNVEVEVFSVLVGLLPTTAENTSTSTFIRKPEAATQFEGLLMMGILMPETC
jgi:hypothetical protein